MGLMANIKRDLRFVAGLRRLLKRIKPIELDSDVLVPDDFEEAVDKFPDNVAVEDEHRSLTYRELDGMANHQVIRFQMIAAISPASITCRPMAPFTVLAMVSPTP